MGPFSAACPFVKPSATISCVSTCSNDSTNPSSTASQSEAMSSLRRLLRTPALLVFTVRTTPSPSLYP